MEVEVRGILDDACFRVYRAGYADTDALDLVHRNARFFAGFLCDLRHAVADVALGTGYVGLAGRLRYDLVVLVAKTCNDIGAAEVNSQSIHM